MAKITKLLIANRGEIAIRIMRAAREMGIRTVAVASEADRHAMHAMVADEVVEIGSPEPGASYLVMDKIIAAAKETGADAVHPGYGFLSERAEFADACVAAGLIFVGPTAAAMRLLGAKIEAKQLAEKCEVPVTPGLFRPGATAEELLAAADTIGFPVMLKASAGGGGRGMRAVHDRARFLDDHRLASDEAVKAFGDGSMMVEKLVLQPRHIEVQILADQHGNIAPLFERECSVQRRHQKLIEESPSPIMTEAIWQRMRDASVRLIRESGYTNAGTVEFMFDEKSGEFYFLEVNARLQVEHPVTELVTGIDLVQWQIRVAQGESLDALDPRILIGDRSGIKGHAMETRIVSEDPARGFLPSVGPIVGWAEPRMPGVRIDTGYGPGSEVSRFYDSMLAKAIVHAENRAGAVTRLESALLDFHILGVKTNIPYLLEVLAHPDFRAGKIDTGFLDRNMPDWEDRSEIPAELGQLVLAASVAKSGGGAGPAEYASVWGSSDDWRNVK